MRVRTAAPPVNLKQRDALVMAHVDLVRSLAARLGRRIPSHIDLSELVSVGVIGLIDAATRYQPALGVPFDAFARRRIHGAMLDALRRLDRVPRSLRRLQRRLDTALTDLRHSLGREPETDELAAALGLTPEAYENFLGDLRWADVVVLHDGQADGTLPNPLEVAVDVEDGPHARLERRELLAKLAEGLAELPERERQILALSYERELTLAEIGQVLGVTESRISQLRTQAIARLRSRMRDWLRVSNAA